MPEITLPKPTETHLTLGLRAAAVLLATILLFFQDFIIIMNDAIHSEAARHFGESWG